MWTSSTPCRCTRSASGSAGPTGSQVGLLLGRWACPHGPCPALCAPPACWGLGVGTLVLGVRWTGCVRVGPEAHLQWGRWHLNMAQRARDLCGHAELFACWCPRLWRGQASLAGASAPRQLQATACQSSTPSRLPWHPLWVAAHLQAHTKHCLARCAHCRPWEAALSAPRGVGRPIGFRAVDIQAYRDLGEFLTWPLQHMSTQPQSATHPGGPAPSVPWGSLSHMPESWLLFPSRLEPEDVTHTFHWLQTQSACSASSNLLPKTSFPTDPPGGPSQGPTCRAAHSHLASPQPPQDARPVESLGPMLPPSF